jgi:hypothetical protein
VTGPLVGDEVAPRLPRRLRHRQDHRTLEDITLHPLLGVFPPQPGQLGLLGPAQAGRGCRCAARSRLTQVASVVSLIPRSRATSAHDFPVSVTILIAPARKSGSYRRLVSAI